MIQLAEKLGMKISTNFVDFIEKEVLPNTNVTAEKFWHGLATMVNELTPQNKRCLTSEGIYKNKLMSGMS